MQKISGEIPFGELTPDGLKELSGKEITGYSCIHKISKGSGFSFVYLKTGRFIFQAVYISELCKTSLKGIQEGTYIRFSGKVKQELRSEHGFEITLTDFEVLSAPAVEYPLNISDKVMSSTLETNLQYRHIALRHPYQRAIMKISEGITDGFSDFMKLNNFTKIHTPKISTDTPLNDANMFRLKYFGNDAVLTHNSVFVKQSAVAVYDRIYEITHAYRADKHNSTRHLNEYMRLDFELAYVNDIADIMNVQTALLKHIIKYLEENYGLELEILNAELPQISTVPAITFAEAVNMLEKPQTQASLDPTDESKLSAYAKAEYNCDFIFVTNLPVEKQPFYVMDCHNAANFSESFVLLYKGREITYGNRKIHDYAKQKHKLEKLGFNPDEFYAYLDLHSCALPPHGGAGTGLERLVAGLLNLETIKEASLFPRDMHHLT